MGQLSILNKYFQELSPSKLVNKPHSIFYCFALTVYWEVLLYLVEIIRYKYRITEISFSRINKTDSHNNFQNSIYGLWSKDFRGGSGQFFSPRVGFRVFWFCSGRVSGFLIFFRVTRKISRVTFGSKIYMFGSKNFGFLTAHSWKIHSPDKIRSQMTKIWRKMQKIGFISHNFLTSGYSG